MTTVTLYGFGVSPHVRAALIAFHEKGVNVDWKQIMTDGLQTEEYGPINPCRKIT